MKKSIIYSYLRHLVFIAYGAALAWNKALHLPITHFNKGEVIAAGQALWIAVIPQIRHTAPLTIDWYLKKRYPALGIVLKDLKAAQNGSQASI